MEMIESIGWIVLGFAPTLVAMEVAWRAGRRRLALAGAGGPLMDYYTAAGLAAMAVVAGLVGLRVARDERLLRRKRVLTE